MSDLVMTEIDSKTYDVYIRWLAEQYEIDLDPWTGAPMLWMQLRNMEYYWVHSRDESMASNVRRYSRDRYYLANEEALSTLYSMEDFRNIETPNVLEVLISFARRMEEEYMSRSDEGDRAYLWFGIFLQNLGIEKYLYCPLSEYDPTDVARKITTWLDRTYDDMGNGGIFPIVEEYRPYVNDQRLESTWQQMYAYTWTQDMVAATDDMKAHWKQLAIERKQK